MNQKSMKITFLGTGTSQGIPMIACDCPVCQSLDYRDKRLRTSIHIAVDDLSLVVDTGPDFRQQMLRENIRKLDAVLFTHQHKDHTAGLDDIRSYNFKDERDMPIYARKQVIEQIKTEFAYIFSGTKYPGIPRISPQEIENKAFKINETEILPVEVMHHQLPVFGFKIKNFTYITDANYINETERKKIEGSEVLVLNALHWATHISHFSVEEAIAMVEVLKPKKAYFTHFSHRIGKHAEVSPRMPENIFLAYDGLKIELE